MKFTYGAYRGLLEELLIRHTPLDYTRLKQKTKPSFIIRHDIDYGLEFLGEIPAIEHELNIQATYFIQVSSEFYNPHSKRNVDILKHLQRLNHRIGLHTNCTSNVPKSELNDYIRYEMSLLSHIVDTIDAVSFHQPPGYVVNNDAKIAFINTYDKQDMDGFDYFSDSRGCWSVGDPVEFIRKKPEASFQILVHPISWSTNGDSFKDRAEMSILQKANNLHDYLVEHCSVFSPQRCSWGGHNE